MELVICASYFAFTGTLSFFIGRLIPKSLFKYDDFPFKSFDFEKDGKIYTKLSVQKWQNKVPDMSRLFKKLMPAKNLSGGIDCTRLSIMIKETCVAEAVHFILCVTGLFCFKILSGIKGALVYAIYVLLGNIPFIIIQRYNRPRLVRLFNRQQKAVKE